MSIGNKIGLGLRKAANLVAYGVVTVRDASHVAGHVIGKQLVDAKLGLIDGIDTDKPARKRVARKH